MKKFLLFFLFVGCVIQLNAQNRESHCGTDELHLKMLKDDPAYKKRFDENNALWQQYAPKHIKPKQSQNKSATINPAGVLNVAFHDVSSTNTYLPLTGTSIDAYQYILDKLNQIYSGTNLVSNTAGNNTGISFCLTRIMNNGDQYNLALSRGSNIPAASGLTRNITAMNSIANGVQSPNFTPSTKNINIYIVDSIIDVPAFATLPSSHGSTSDGIYITRSSLINDPNFNQNMDTLAHEMGHYLGLFHIFGICDPTVIGSLDVPDPNHPGQITNPCSCDNGNCLFNGDMVCDTAPSMLLQPANYTCLINTCSTDATPHYINSVNVNPITTDVQDNKNNYMDYGFVNCHSEFTPGQILRMQFMIDPVDGVRKSLLGHSACVDCGAMNGCSFSITPPSIIKTIATNPSQPLQNQVTQISNTTPTLNFTANESCVAIVIYNWDLVLLGSPNQSIVTGYTGTTFNTSSSGVPALAAGNYQLTLTAISANNIACSETVTYNFTVLPTATPCLLNVPNTNNPADWTGANWERISIENGWIYTGVFPLGNYPVGSTGPIFNGQFGFDADGFDVIPIVPGGTIIPSDPNFTGVTLPSSANINKVMRVGKKIGGGGQAFFARTTLNINRTNCKFRIWYIGATQGISANINYPINELLTYSFKNDAAFGLLSKYHYNSPVNTITSNLNTTLGDDYNIQYGKYTNYFVSNNDNYNSPPSDFTLGGGFYRMTAWKHIDLDYSEFVDLTPETEITLTFFSHSNIENNAQEESYAYYGIECLGGGIPSDFTIDIPNINLPCTSPGNSSCTDPIYIPKAAYDFFSLNSTVPNFDNVKVYKIDDQGVETLYPNPFDVNGQMIICLNQNDAPFKDFHIVYKTLYKVVDDYFRIFVGFYNNLPDCTTGDAWDTSYPPQSNMVNGDLLLCGITDLPILKLTDTCIQVPSTYQWYCDDYIINGATNKELQLAYQPTPAVFSYTNLTTSFNYEPLGCHNYYRKTIYKEPYCGNDKVKKSNVFHIYNKQAIMLLKGGLTKNNICFGDSYNLTINNGRLFNKGCTIPSHLIDHDTIHLGTYINHLTFQLVDHATQQPIGNVINYSFTGPVMNAYNYIPLNFTFNNINPTPPGNTNPFYIPTSTLFQFPIDIRITGDYLGCPLDVASHTVPIDTLVFGSSAIGGTISYSCVSTTISSTDPGISNNNAYEWEWSYNSNFYTINALSGNPTGAGITSLNLAQFNSYPVYIRRKSITPNLNCPNPDYSNTIIINQTPSTPLFDPISVCKGSTGILPTISTNGITGTWTHNNIPVTTINTTTVGSFTYTFVPASGQCTGAASYSVTVQVTNTTTLTFPPASVCSGDPSPLPSSASIGYPGSWSPAYDATTSQTYTYTPTASSCVLAGTKVVNVKTVPVFTLPTSYCVGDTPASLPTTYNGTTGVWSPSVISTTTVGTSNYVFSASGYCPYTLAVTISEPTNTPSFSLPPQICFGNTPPLLHTTSDNGITGTWSPAVVSSTQDGTYTFTPNSGQCALSYSTAISIITSCGISISWDSDVSCQVANPKPKDGIHSYANIADGPCIRVCENSTITYTLAGGTGAIVSTDWNVTGGDVQSYTNTSVTITWTTASYCALQGVIHLYDGTTLLINKCIEKLIAPTALFGIAPNVHNTDYNVCIHLPIQFENLSTNNGGNDALYYNWDFGDGITSNQFEPIHSYTHPGDYVVTLTVFNGCSCASRYQITIHVNDSTVAIECPSVVCENTLNTYSIDTGYTSNCPDTIWTVYGGHLLNTSNNNTTVQVIWDAVGADGFGYIDVNSSQCLQCTSQVKIPVIQQHGTIKGDAVMCAKNQATYSLPQWPSTVFNWTINNNGTGAVLIANGNRNEIVVQSGSHGTIELDCTYYNTLLNCGGTAHFTIYVKQFATITGHPTACEQTPMVYPVIDETGAAINAVHWTINGPNNYVLAGGTAPINVSFPTSGIYIITITDALFCSHLYQVLVKELPAGPTAINGSQVVCPGIAGTYSCPAPSGSTTYWSVTNGTILGSNTGNTISVAFDPNAALTAPYTITAYYHGEDCDSQSFTQTVVRDIPNVNITPANATVCGSSLETYQANYSSGEDYVWAIQPETAGSVQQGQNTDTVTILWNQSPGTATVKLTVRKCGHDFAFTTPVTIIDHPVVSINAPSQACVGNSITVDFTMNIGNTFTGVVWDFGDGNVLPSQNTSSTTHIYAYPLTASTTYTITATVTGANGCLMPAVVHIPITVSPSPVIDITPKTGLNLCDVNNVPSNYIYAVTMQGGFSPTDVVHWYHNGTPISSGPTIDLHNTGVGNYYATVTNSFGCTSQTATINVHDNCTGCTAPYNIAAVATNMGCQEIQIQTTLIEGTPNNVYWSNTTLPGATITANDWYNFAATNVPPGTYNITLNADYTIGGTICTTHRYIPFTIPYKADIKYTVTCGSGGMYNVVLLDHSVYYATTPIQNYSFTVDNGLNWYASTVVGGINQFATTLPPGSHTVGIRIAGSGYAACEYYTTLDLPAMPSANFTFDPACQGTAVQFHASDTTPGLQYSWSFSYTATNLQQNPVRTFNGSGNFPVTLTVTNQYGCSVNHTALVHVTGVNMHGELDSTPNTACEGSNITINYNPLASTMPSHFIWYHNEVTNPPYAVTNTPSITVTQSGQYFVYVQDSNGCSYYENKATSANFIPAPTAPVIKGAAVVCENTIIDLTIPANPNLHYVWSLNGLVHNEWNDHTEITGFSLTAGTYIFSVVAQTSNGSGGYCSSVPASYTVTVVTLPDVPELEIQQPISCDPYQVYVNITNPQNGVNYYWSNGATGTTTVITHDGPLEVRAEIFDCQVTSQIDLPRDLTALGWEFPSGCYAVCPDTFSGYVVNPLGSFDEWQWIEDGTVVIDGSGPIADFDQLETGHDYQLQITNGDCQTTLANLNLSETECAPCHIPLEISNINCLNINGVNLYSLTVVTNNTYGMPVSISLSAPNGEGYFDTATMVIPIGVSTHTLQFYPLNGFTGGTVHVNIQGIWLNHTCISEMTMNFPKECKPITTCDFKYDVKGISCIHTPTGIVYNVVFVLTNPYSIPATSTLSVPNQEGYFVPSVLLVSPGVGTYQALFYPINGFQAGGADVLFDTGFTNFHCPKLMHLDFKPENCIDPVSCDFKITLAEKPICTNMGNTVFAYQVSMNFFNPYSTPVTITLTAPNGEGYFDTASLVLPVGPSNPVVYFYTLNGFIGGNVIISYGGLANGEYCINKFEIDFPIPCCLDCRAVDLNNPSLAAINVLEVAPNPAHSSTTIFYNFVNSKANKKIELTDVLGRTLQVWTLQDSKGTIEMDCSKYANGQYLILMKENDAVIKNAKLLTN